MSLIIDSLKKIKKSADRKLLPPNLKPEKKKNKRLFLLASVVIVLFILFLALKILENELIINEEYEHISIRQVKKPVETSVSQKQDKSIEKNIRKTPKNSITPKTDTSLKNVQHKKHQSKKPQTPPTPKKIEKGKYVFYVTQANKYLKKKEYQKSLMFYQKAYSIKPEESILTNIIILKIKSGNNNIKEEIKSIKSEKNLYKIALVAINSGKYQLIKEFLQKRSSQDSSGITDYLLGIIYEKEGKLNDAEKQYKEAFRKNPSNPYISYAYGRILEINGKRSISRKIYEHTLKIIKDKSSKLWKVVYERLKTSGGSYE